MLISHVDVCEETGHIVLALPATKTSKQHMESVAVQDTRLASLLQVVLDTTVTSTVAHFQLHDYGFTAYSIRRGGATHAFANGHHFDTLLVKGRWQSAKTARQYLDSGRATLVQLQFSGIMASSLQLIASAYGRGALLSAETGILSAPILV